MSTKKVGELHKTKFINFLTIGPEIWQGEMKKRWISMNKALYVDTKFNEQETKRAFGSAAVTDVQEWTEMMISSSSQADSL